jgi:PAS domain-containing protein
MIGSPEKQPPAKDANAENAAKALLDESEENYRGLFENAVTGIFQTTPQGRFLRVNPALAAMFGYASPQEMIQNITDISTQLYTDPAERKKILNLCTATGTISLHL